MHNSRLQARTRQQLNELSRQAGNTDAVDFFNLLTGPELLELTDAHLPEHRERLYPPTVTLSMFIQQVLSEDGSCQRAVNGWAAQCTAEGLPFQSVRTGGYCRARQRLPLAMVQSLTRVSGDRLSSGVHPGWRWRNRPVKLVDGTGLSMRIRRTIRRIFPSRVRKLRAWAFPPRNWSA